MNETQNQQRFFSSLSLSLIFLLPLICSIPLGHTQELIISATPRDCKEKLSSALTPISKIIKHPTLAAFKNYKENVANLQIDLELYTHQTIHQNVFMPELGDTRFLMTNEHNLNQISDIHLQHPELFNKSKIKNKQRKAKVSLVIGQSDFPFLFNETVESDVIIVADYNVTQLNLVRSIAGLVKAAKSYQDFEKKLRAYFEDFVEDGLNSLREVPSAEVKKIMKKMALNNLEIYLGSKSLISKYKNEKEKNRAFVATKALLAKKQVHYVPLNLTDEDQLSELGEVLKRNHAEINFANFNNVIPYVENRNLRKKQIALTLTNRLPFSDETLIYARRMVDSKEGGAYTVGVNDFLKKY